MSKNHQLAQLNSFVANKEIMKKHFRFDLLDMCSKGKNKHIGCIGRDKTLRRCYTKMLLDD